MAMVDRQEIERIAALARIRLGSDEAAQLADDCRSILDYFESIRELDGLEAEPAETLERPAPSRDDVIDANPLTLAPGDLAPAWRGGYFVLPRLPALDAEEVSED